MPLCPLNQHHSASIFITLVVVCVLIYITAFTLVPRILRLTFTNLTAVGIFSDGKYVQDIIEMHIPLIFLDINKGVPGTRHHLSIKILTPKILWSSVSLFHSLLIYLFMLTKCFMVISPPLVSWLSLWEKYGLCFQSLKVLMCGETQFMYYKVKFRWKVAWEPASPCIFFNISLLLSIFLSLTFLLIFFP